MLSTAVAAGAIGAPRVVSFDQIDVHRINVREPDGTLRLVLSNKASLPGIVVRGRELPHAGRRGSAGLLFFNDEGTENGGLIFAGARSGGVVHSGGHLSFDQYDQDQVLSLEQSEEGSDRSAGLGVSDRPDRALDYEGLARLEAMPDGPEKTALSQRLASRGDFGAPRLFIGKTDHASVLSLRDAAGRKRLVLQVTAAGEASIKFLDASGKVVQTVQPSSG